jgi:C_GCAxxG_C_C family probable redox protein
MSLKDAVASYRTEAYDYSCSESTIRGCNKYYNLNMTEDAMRMMAGFSGGMYIGGLCGINAASVAVISHIFTQDVAHKTPELPVIIKEYYDLFDQKYGSHICSELKDEQYEKRGSCSPLITESAEILEQVIAKYR